MSRPEMTLDEIKIWANKAALSYSKQIALITAGLSILFCLLWIWHLGDQFFSNSKAYSSNTSRAMVASPDISQWHLFGRFDASLANLPATHLQLTLEGTIWDPGSQQLSRALISAPGVITKSYKIGQLLPGGASLRRILNDNVVLDNNGSYESLRLPVPLLQQQG